MVIQAKKHWSTKSEAARDEVKDAVEEAVAWVITHQRQALWSFGGAAAAALALGLIVYSRHTKNMGAWDKLSQAEVYAYSGRGADAQAAIAEAAGGTSPGAAALAHMLAGDLLYPKGEYDGALAAYDKAALEAPEGLRPFALADKIMTLEAAGKNAECAAAAQSFVDSLSDHLLTPQVHSTLARCQSAAGQADAAKATLQRISLQYPNTPWAEWANARLAATAK